MAGGSAPCQSPYDDVLSFWFGPDKADRWFVSDPAFDRLVAAHLAHPLAAAAAVPSPGSSAPG